MFIYFIFLWTPQKLIWVKFFSNMRCSIQIKNAFKLLFLLPFITFVTSCNSTKVLPEKASPFTAVKWNDSIPQVQYNGEWYSMEKLDHLTTNEILRFCKKEYQHKWKKRFSEDLIEVLKKMNYTPGNTVQLQLVKNGESKSYTGTLTYENRQLVLKYNRGNKNNVPDKGKKVLSVSEAIEDITEFQKTIEEKSSYVQLSSFDYLKSIEQLKERIKINNTTVKRTRLTYELGKILSLIGDRHSSVKNEGFDDSKCSSCQLRFPVALALLNGKVLALKSAEFPKYQFFDVSFPFVVKINGMSTEDFIRKYTYKHQMAPKKIWLERGINEIHKIGQLIYVQGQKHFSKIELTLSNEKDEKNVSLDLTTSKQDYIPRLQIESYFKQGKIKKTRQFNELSQLIEGNIGYISLPKMYNYESLPELESFIQTTFSDFQKTKAIIIDLRYNPGGRRDLIPTIAKYVVPDTLSPWIANVTYVRTPQKTDEIDEAMAARHLFQKNSGKYTKQDQQAIDLFINDFTPYRKVNSSKFTSPYFMLLKSGTQSYKGTVYLLVNGYSFSAASVFAAAFKGLPNVKIVGTNTDGSSGNSRIFYLKHSNIRIKVSTMVSYQRNGKTLDGNGTPPDILIKPNEKQVFGEQDFQLNQLLKHIDRNKR